MLSKEQDFFLTALSDHLNGRKTIVPNGLDEELISIISKQQQCEGIVYYQSHLSRLQPQFASNSYYAVNRKRILEKIHLEFTKHNIPYLIFKGSEVADFYPIPQLRTMGDSDIMIHEEDKLRAHELLLSLGFINECLGPNEWVYHYGALEFELHHRLMNDELVSLPIHNAFMSSVWEHTTTEDGIQYHIDWDYHLVFLLLHLRKHFMNSGVGFRQFMDIAVVIKNNSLDLDAFQKDVEELQISGFAYTCIAFIKRWFGTEIPISVDAIEESFYETATRQIFDNGVFGDDDPANKENYYCEQIKKSNRWSIYFKKISVLFFPPYRDIAYTEKYSFIRNKPYLLPIAWIYRAFFAVFHHRTIDSQAVHIESRVSEEKLNNRNEYLRMWKLEE